MKVPFEFAGQSGEYQSTQFGKEITRNMYMVKSETSGKVAAVVFPGLKAFGTGTGQSRGAHVMNGVRYLINATTLFSESSTKIRVSLGTIAGTDRAIFSDDGTNLMIVANNTIYRYSTSSGAVSTVTQSVVTNPSSITYINQQFLISGDDQKFAVSDVDDPTTWNALNFDYEKTNPDSLLRVYAYKQLVYMLGNKSIPTWRNTGTGNPPFSRQESSLVNVGIAGKYAIAETSKYLYFLSDDKRPFQSAGAVGRPINTSGISYIIEGLSTVSDCVCSSFIWKGQTFVMFKFPTDGVCLLYSEENNVWTELNSGTEADVRNSWYGEDACLCYGKVLVTDYRNGNTYELDEQTFTDNGDTRLWVKSLPTITGNSINAPGRRVLTKYMQLEMQKGVGTIATSNPVIICQWSNDGGEVYGTQQNVEIGKMGDHHRLVRFDQFANGYEVKARVMGSDPVEICIWGGHYEVRDGGY